MNLELLELYQTGSMYCFESMSKFFSLVRGVYLSHDYWFLSSG